ncbi:MAG: T9SS type A sorting domain-containing protein, partial [Bacteroidota bacterium]
CGNNVDDDCDGQTDEGCGAPLTVDAGDCSAVYFGYPPNECAALTAVATGGTLPYTFAWSNGATTAIISVCPAVTTDYTVTATDANGATATDIVTVEVVDVRCGNNMNKVNICHNPSGNSNTLCVAQSAVPAHLAHGDYLGACGTPPCSGSNSMIAPPATNDPLNTHALHTSLICEPNPFTGEITFQFSASEEASSADLVVLDSKGVIVDWALKQAQVQGVQRIVWQAGELAAGIYFVRLKIAGEVQTQRIVLIR